MNLTKKADKLGKKMKWYDFSMLKLSTLFFTLFLITVWPEFLQAVLRVNWYWYLILGILLAVPIGKKMFSQ